MSFSEDVNRFDDQLVELVGAGVAVREPAAAWGISSSYIIGKAVNTEDEDWEF
ncbi:hypothetical protein [Nocardia sp. NPDC005745]|uniref:hypothetical protein n=1 Tax=Nocardia sp. NPDC005745 TaxID=3157061 RepID=UPI0033D9B3AF